MNATSVKQLVLWITLMSVPLAPAVTSAAQVDYDVPGDLTANFALNVDPPTTVRYAEVATGGLAGSGAVNMLNTLDSAHTTAVYSPGSFDFSFSGSKITFSQFILRKTAILSVTPFYQMGILSDLGERMDDIAAANSYASVRLMPDAVNTANDIFLQTETRINGGSRVRVTPGITATLTAGHWYRFSGSITHLSSTDILVSAELEDWGTSGAAFVSTVMQLNPLVVALSGPDQVNGDSSVWVGWRTFDEGGADLVDDFAAEQTSEVPAVSTWGMIVMALFLGSAASVMLLRREGAIA